MAASNSVRWSEMSPYLDEALQLETGKREPWLAALEATDPALAAELRELLALHAANCASGFMERSPLAAEEFLTGRWGSGDARLPVGHLLGGRYRIERVLGEGGMGMVYLARDEQVAGEMFAVKVLKEDLDPEAFALLREEVRRTRKLSHPNIVDVHSVNIDGQRLYLLMEYLEGKSLEALLAEEFGRGMPFSHAWPIIKDVGAAVGNAHDHNIIHSDLKPANVFMTTSGRTKLLDFGIARVSRALTLHARYGPRGLTPAFASCEMLEGKEADRRDDIYSFACVIYKMLCGERPFGDLDALEAREAGARVQPLGVLTQEQNAALACALAFDRSGRTSSVEELLEGLAAEHEPRRRLLAVPGTAIIATLVAVGLAWLVLDKLGISRHPVELQSAAPAVQQTASPAAHDAVFNPPPHSIAVLPFVNMSGDNERDYFSDGLTEELLNSLSRISELQVAARTSSFSLKGKDTDIGTIARKLNVGAVLEGSVRRSGNRLRVTAQLNNALTGFHIWSQTYDRDLGDVLTLQTEIADAVASALKVTLLGQEAARIELGGTRNPAAFDAYLRALKAVQSRREAKDLPAAIAVYTEAIRLDPNFALAFARRSTALSDYTDQVATGTGIRAGYEKAEADARRAIALAPDLAEAHLALAEVSESYLDFARASKEYERALALAPGNAYVLRESSSFASLMGHFDTAIAAARRGVVLDPLNRSSHNGLGNVLSAARRYGEAVTAYSEAISLNPDYKLTHAARGLAYYGLGDLGSARASCEIKRDLHASQQCLAVVYDKLGRHADAEVELAKIETALGDGSAYTYATIYAQWGDHPKALGWLDTAMRLRDQALVFLKTDPLMDPLRSEPRFQAIERRLKFPD
jgi:eukaryotic-like serine/threonine-protein kinase